MIANKEYPLLLWVTTLLIAPILFTAYDIIEYGKNALKNDLPLGLLIFLVGAAFSLPIFIIVYFLFKFLTNKTISGFLIKGTLNVVCIISIWIIFALIKGSMAQMSTLIYSGSVILSSVFYKIYNKPKISN
jgi:hypothetical protein